VTLLAGVLAGGGYLGVAYASELWQVYLLYSLGSIGVGIVYTVAINTALKWFPKRRGLTTGLGTMAFAAGAALFVPYVRANATVAGYPRVLRNIGVLIGVVIVLGALVLEDPPARFFESDESDPTVGPATSESDDDSEPATDGPETDPSREYTWREFLATRQFWLLYAMFVGVSAAGLMLTAKIVSYAGATDVPAAAATAAATFLPLASGAGRIVLGDLADRVDARRTMAGAFVLCGLGVFAVVGAAGLGTNLGFVLAVGVATFFWSSQYSLFPVIVTDYYGAAESSANNALLYSGKIWGGVFGGAAASWLAVTVGWDATFLLGGALSVLAGLGALVVSPPADRNAATADEGA
jgi:OFA family oxalate/formate antiporter-like MFS transporter